MPGLPGHDTELWQEDILQTIKLRPGVVRIYPCLVLRETELARRYMAGLFQPWSLEQAVERAGQALLQFWQAKIRVIRLGLLGDLQDILVAGPWHPAFGTMARSMALFFLLRQHVEVREGRGTLRKAGESCERAPIPGCPNGEIRLSEPQSSTYEYIVCQGEPGELKHLSNRRKKKD